MESIESIISLVTSITAIVTSILTFIVNYVVQKNKDRKEKRVIPTISILDNKEDDIDYRFQNLNTRVFMNSKDVFQLNKKHYLYVCIYNYYEYKMINCAVRNSLNNVEKSIGVILPNKCVIIPLEIQKATQLSVEMEYDTEENEKLIYKLQIEVPSFSNRQDFLYSSKREIKKIKAGLNISMSTSELISKAYSLNFDKQDNM